MLNKTLFTVIGLLFIVLTACTNTQKFDRDKWDDGDGITFANRDRIVDDLLQNYKLKGLKYQQVIHLLHRPQFSSKDSMYYEINQPQYDGGKLISAKNLVLYLKDSVVTEAKIREIKVVKK